MPPETQQPRSLPCERLAEHCTPTSLALPTHNLASISTLARTVMI